MRDRWLVAVGAGRWQMSGIRAAQAEGVRVLALDGFADAPGFSIADRSAVVDIRNVGAVVDTVRAARIRPAGAAAFVTDAGMPGAAAIRDAYDLPGPRSEIVLRMTNKEYQRRAWTDARLQGPAWFAAALEEDAAAGIETLSDTIVVKPVDSAGSRGVAVVHRGEDWRSAFGSALRQSHAGRAIIESFIEGVEYAVETFSHTGATTVLAVSEKRKVPASRGTVAIELATPSVPQAIVDGIGQFACEALAALGYADGPGHTEILRQHDGSLWLVESAGRAGGFMVADGIVPRASRFDIARATALQAVGLAPSPPPNVVRQAFVLRFLPARRGIVTGMRGFDRANALDNVDCRPLVAIGDDVAAPDTDGARLAYILTWAKDRVSALAQADRAEAMIEVDVACRRPRKS